VDPTFERQVAFNQQMVEIMREVLERVATYLKGTEEKTCDTMQRQRELEDHLTRVETWLGLLSTQVILAEKDRSAGLDDDQLAGLYQRVEELHDRLIQQQRRQSDT
jgi:hypothetical protein